MREASMRPIGDAEAEAVVLATDSGRALLAEVRSVATPGPGDLARWRRTRTAELVTAAVRLAEAGRRGAAKFSRSDRMWLETTGVEQATAEAVARHKAARFGRVGSGDPIVDLCCGIGGDALAMAEVGPVLAVDLDGGMARRTRWNAGVYGVADRVLAIRGRAERVAIPEGARVHVDPDRRAGGGPRAKSVHGYAPGLDFLLTLPGRVRGGAIKLGPASDFEAHFGGSVYEVELISLGGECKEATAWFGDLAGCRRRATSLPSGATWSDADGPPGAGAGTGPVGARVFVPDPALARAGLIGGFAAAHGLSRIFGDLDVLTGAGPVGSPLLAEFAVREVLPADRKRLRRLVADRGLGPLEIKVRGLDLRPESLRRELRATGTQPATLLLLGSKHAGTSLAILAERARPGAT
jgi:hypothetical protein